jgi:hypothetical protein
VKLEAFIFDVFPMSSRIEGQPSGAEDENKFTEQGSLKSHKEAVEWVLSSRISRYVQ